MSIETENRIAVEHVAIDRLNPDPLNPRIIDDSAFARLKRGIEAFGLVDPIIARRDDGLVIGGHQRLRAIRELGWATVPVVWLDDLDDDRARVLNILLNNPQASGRWEYATLAQTLEHLKAVDLDIALTGFEPVDLDMIEHWLPDSKAAIDGSPVHLRTWTTVEHRETRRTAVETVGYDLASVWHDLTDKDTRLQQYVLPTPSLQNPGDVLRSHYARPPLRETERIVRTYMRPGDRFLEVCVGWATFAATAALWGYSGIGVDIWDTALGCSRRQLDALPAGCGRVEIRKADGRQLPFDTDAFDFAYTNPPFYGVERYGGGEADLSYRHDLSEWLSESGKMLAEIGRVVKPGGLIVTIMADYRDKGVLVPLGARWIDEGMRQGLALHDFVIQRTRSQQVRLWPLAWKARRTAKAHEYVITFRVPD